MRYFSKVFTLFLAMMMVVGHIPMVALGAEADVSITQSEPDTTVPDKSVEPEQPADPEDSSEPDEPLPTEEVDVSGGSEHLETANESIEDEGAAVADSSEEEIVAAASIVISNPTPNLSSESYNGLNPFEFRGYMDCSRYAWGRFHELFGEQLYLWSGGTLPWYEAAIYHGYEVGAEPRVDSIALWDNNSGGHAAYVEEVSSTHVTITEGGYSGPGAGYAGDPNCHIEEIPIAKMNKAGALRDGDILIGYIYPKVDSLIFELKEVGGVAGDYTLRTRGVKVNTTYEFIIRDPNTGVELSPGTYGISAGPGIFPSKSLNFSARTIRYTETGTDKFTVSSNNLAACGRRSSAAVIKVVEGGGFASGIDTFPSSRTMATNDQYTVSVRTTPSSSFFPDNVTTTTTGGLSVAPGNEQGDYIIRSSAAGTGTVTFEAWYDETPGAKMTATFTATVEALATGLTLDQDTVSITSDSNWLPITANAVGGRLPENVYWTSSNPAIVGVSSATGKTVYLNGIGNGTATVTASFMVDGGTTKNASCQVTVTGLAPPATGIAFDKATLSLEPGDSYLRLYVDAIPSGSALPSYGATGTWSSSNRRAAIVENGKVTAINDGIATITYTAVWGSVTKTATCLVTVGDGGTESYTKDFKLEPSTASVPQGKTVTLTPVPKDGSKILDPSLTFTWTSSNNSVATVSGGQVTGVNASTSAVTITASGGGKSATAKVTVTTAPVELTGVTIGPVVSVMPSGTLRSFYARPNHGSVIPAGATFLWTVTDSSVPGVLTLSGETTASPTVTAGEMGAATLNVTVTPDPAEPLATFTASLTLTVTAPVVQSITLGYGHQDLMVGGDFVLEPTVLPANADQAVAWSSSNPRVAAVDENGLVSAISPGTATITATAAGGKTAVCSVTISAVAGDITLGRTEVLLYNNESTSTNITVANTTGRPTQLYVIDTATGQTDYTKTTTIDNSHMRAELTDNSTLRLTPKADGDGTFDIVVTVDATGAPAAVCHVRVAPAPAASGVQYAKLHAGATALTIYTKSTVPAVLPLWREASGTPLKINGLDNTDPDNPGIRFVPTSASATAIDLAFELDEKFSLSADGEGGITILPRVAAPELKSSYKVKLAVRAPGYEGNGQLGEGWLEFKETITLKLNKGNPKLKAAAISLNAFYDQGAPEASKAISVTGGDIASIEIDEAKTKPAILAAFTKDTSFSANHTIHVSAPLAKKISGTVYLNVKLNGWIDAISVPVKVTCATTPPALKLASTTAKVYDAGIHTQNFSTGVSMTLKPKSASVELGTMNITKAFVIQTLIGTETNTYKFQDDYILSDFNPATGAFTLNLKNGQAPTNKSKVLLGFQVRSIANENATRQIVRLPVTISAVKTATRISLKANKSTITLNPNQVNGGEAYTVNITPSVADFNLDSYTLDEPKVYKSNGKTELAGADNPLDITLDGYSLTIKAVNSATVKNQTYKVKLNADDVNAHVGKGATNATLTLTVKFTKGSTPTIGGSIKGKPNLTTLAPATLTLKSTGSLSGLDTTQWYTFTVYDKSGATALPAAQQKAFTFTQTGPVTFRVGFSKLLGTMDSDGYVALAAGSYQLKVTGVLPSGDPVETKGIKFTIAAAKPKITTSTNKVTLYRGDATSRGVVTLTLPAGTAPLYGPSDDGTALNAQYAVKVKGANANLYTVRYMADNRYAIMFKDKNAADTVKGKTLTLELYTAGNTKVTATVKVSVAVKAL